MGAPPLFFSLSLERGPLPFPKTSKEVFFSSKDPPSHLAGRHRGEFLFSFRRRLFVGIAPLFPPQEIRLPPPLFFLYGMGLAASTQPNP